MVAVTAKCTNWGSVSSDDATYANYFLESLLKLDIADIQIEDEVSLEKLRETEKGGRLDLQAILNNGTIVNLELQIRNEYNIEERTTYYSSKVISRETQRGTAYEDIKNVFCVRSSCKIKDTFYV